MNGAGEDPAPAIIVSAVDNGACALVNSWYGDTVKIKVKTDE